MTARQFLARCDTPGCTTALVLHADNPTAARTQAHDDHGWTTDGDTDHCPVHKPA